MGKALSGNPLSTIGLGRCHTVAAAAADADGLVRSVLLDVRPTGGQAATVAANGAECV